MKVLVTAASKHGATSEIATVIGDVLESQGLDVEVLPPDEVGRIDGYDAVVLGSGVYAGHWLKPAKEFAERHGPELRARRVFLFSSGPVGEPPKESDVPVDIAGVRAATGAVDHRVFSGRITASQLGPFEKLVVRVVKAPLADDRPWDDIVDWAKQITSSLHDEPRRAAPTAPVAVT